MKSTKDNAGWKNVVHMLTTGVWAILDQGTFALSNFLINVCLARWLIPSDYGAFATAFMLLLMLGALHSALITEPMVVFSSGVYKSRISDYAGTALYIHWVFCGILSCLCLVAGMIAWHQHSDALALSLMGLAVANPMILYQWLARRITYTRSKPYLASCAGALYLLLISVGSLILFHYDVVTGLGFLILMGMASFCSGLWLLAHLELSNDASRRDFSIREVLYKHWDYGKWMLGINLLSWAFGNAFVFLLPLVTGFESTGAARALLLLLMPMFLVITATNHFLLPLFVKWGKDGRFTRMVWITTLCLTLAAAGYSLMIAFFSSSIIRVLFAGQYIEHSNLLWILGILPSLFAFTMVLGIGLRAIQGPARQFASFFRSSYIALPVGLLLTASWGLPGALMATVLAHTILALFLIYEYCWLHDFETSGPTSLMRPSVEPN